MKTRFHPLSAGILSVSIAAWLGCAGTGQTDDARVLPEGRSQLYADFYRYHDTTQRYNADGKREALADPFTNAALDSTVLESLAPLDPFVGGTASIGDVSVAYQYDIDVLDVGYSYGVSEQLSIGFHVPYYWIDNRVDTDFDNSTANVGLNPLTGECCIPIAIGGQPMDIDDVQDLVSAEYGFDEIDDWSREGIGDIELGAKYRFFLEPESALAFSGGLRVPSGYEDDADKLNDVAWSYGNYAILLRLHYDYLLSDLWSGGNGRLHQLPAAGDLVVNLTLRYDYMLPDRKTMRIGDSPQQVLTANRERVDRELGDIYQFEVSTRYHATPALAVNLTYTYGGKFEDDIDGDMGFNYASLEADTDSEQQIVIVEASYSTLNAWTQGRSAAPMEFSLAYRERFDGAGPSSGQANPVLYTRWLTAGVSVLF